MFSYTTAGGRQQATCKVYILYFIEAKPLRNSAKHFQFILWYQDQDSEHIFSPPSPISLLFLPWGRYDHGQPVLHHQAFPGHGDSDVRGSSRGPGPDSAPSVPHRHPGLEAESPSLLRSHDYLCHHRFHLPATQPQRYCRTFRSTMVFISLVHCRLPC